MKIKDYGKYVWMWFMNRKYNSYENNEICDIQVNGIGKQRHTMMHLSVINDVPSLEDMFKHAIDLCDFNLMQYHILYLCDTHYIQYTLESNRYHFNRISSTQT